METTKRIGDDHGDGTPSHIWETHDEDGTIVAKLQISMDRHEIMNIEVHKNYLREGHATHLYEVAAAAMDIYHAPEAHRSPDGHAFAEAVGGDTVPAYPCDCYTCTNTDDEDDDQ